MGAVDDRRDRREPAGAEKHPFSSGSEGILQVFLPQKSLDSRSGVADLLETSRSDPELPALLSAQAEPSSLLLLRERSSSEAAGHQTPAPPSGGRTCTSSFSRLRSGDQAELFQTSF